MDRNNEKLHEQEAPLKNTDNAFVQVGKDGQPQVPEKNSDSERTESEIEKDEELRSRH